MQIATRASGEVNELLRGIINQASVKSIHEELADCAVMFWQVAELLGLPARPRFATPPHRNQNVALVAAQLNRRFGTVLEELIMASMYEGAHGQNHAVTVANNVFSDTLRLLELLAFKFGIELAEHVDVKMVVNRARDWKRVASGDYQHVGAQA